LDRCEVSVMTPFDPMEPWSGSIIGSEPNNGTEMMTPCARTASPLLQHCLSRFS
jgi:hypothetical protein